VTISHYWTARRYNVYHWIHDGRTIAYYCNIVGATTIAEDLVSYEDLVVDVLIEPSGASLVLDEDDLPDDLPSAKRVAVNRALEELTGQTRRIAAEIERESRRYL
jgi:predicted RNA-binding protein associated with RNAse of E/G family